MIRFKDNIKRHTFLDVISYIVDARKIEFYIPVGIRDIAAKIKEMDTRLEPTDIDIVACAIENKAINLVTIDAKLIGNKSIEREFGLKIVHPKQLL